MEYVIVKWLHVLSATVVFGTGIGSAFHMLMASLRRDPAIAAQVVRQVVWADWLFTTSTMVFQPLSGWYLAHLMGMPVLQTRWLAGSLLLYVVAGLCWLPVVVIQIRMRDLALQAQHAGTALPPRYFFLLRWWTALGVPALLAFLGVFYLMVAKPV
ncbi:DUF2269 family protein [Roseateles terrae]|uniref:Membrane protein n=1 Tax=Roseateles terrae TaxID=431060 RepID=A0ABR6GTB7_9BURK|nr:DUF2269 domain-containing protein [Roseateles terrae]MBB3195348.1 putative membrane protein [Roseateles terrae]OWQ87338.1 hypothetical protein CDN98_10985 [Roseateles terrae]